jgi:hypothetical protein
MSAKACTKDMECASGPVCRSSCAARDEQLRTGYVPDLKLPALRQYRLPLLRTALRAQASQDVPASMRHHCAHNRFRGIQGVRP